MQFHDPCSEAADRDFQRAEDQDGLALFDQSPRGSERHLGLIVREAVPAPSGGGLGFEVARDEGLVVADGDAEPGVPGFAPFNDPELLAGRSPVLAVESLSCVVGDPVDEVVELLVLGEHRR